jgi:hypothetical protein
VGVSDPSGGDEFSRLADLVFSGRAGEAEEARLAELLAKDPARRQEFFKILDLHRLLPLAREGTEDAERFLQSLRARAQARRDGGEFLAAARRRILSTRARARFRRIGAAAAALGIVALGLGYAVLRAPDVAQVDPVRGTVHLRRNGETAVLSGPRGLRAGQGIETAGPQASAVLRFPDGTTVELSSATRVEGVEDSPAGKRLFLRRGRAAALVPRQPEGRPMVFATPQGEARVLGTSLKILVDNGLKGSTRLEVHEGKVRLTRSDGASVEVVAGHYAVAAAGVDLAAKPLPSPGEPAARAVVARMPPGSWLSVPDTLLSRVMPSREQYPKIQGITGPTSVVVAWSGGALDPRRNRLYVWGGGHSDYYGNELYAFDLNSLAWERLTDPTADPALGRQTNADGTPNSRATYNGLAFITHADCLFASGGMLAGSDGLAADVTWTFDPAARRWVDRKPPSSSGGGFGCNASYDPATRKVWWGSAAGSFAGLWSYDYDRNAWTKHNSDNFGEYTSAMDTRRGHLVVVGNGEVFSYDVRKADFTRQAWATSGGEPFIRKKAVGLDYDPVSDRIAGWHGGAVYALDPSSRRWTADDAPGAPATTPNGVYGRWRYVPDLGVFVVVTSIDTNVHFYKPAR